jgi:hypothetical protein
MLELFLDCNMIENINFMDNYIENANINKNIMKFVNKYDLIIKWDMKKSLYKKAALSNLIQEIQSTYLDFNSIKTQNMHFKYVKIQLDRYCNWFYDMDMIESLISEIRHYDKKDIFPNICENIAGIKIKHQLLVIANLINFSKNKYLVKPIFDYFEWNDLDIEIINKFNLEYNLDICLF